MMPVSVIVTRAISRNDQNRVDRQAVLRASRKLITATIKLDCIVNKERAFSPPSMLVWKRPGTCADILILSAIPTVAQSATTKKDARAHLSDMPLCYPDLAQNLVATHVR